MILNQVSLYYICANISVIDESFKHLDKDNDGHITAHELAKRGVMEVGYHPTEEQAEKLIEKLTKKGKNI